MRTPHWLALLASALVMLFAGVATSELGRMRLVLALEAPDGQAPPDGGDETGPSDDNPPPDEGDDGEDDGDGGDEDEEYELA